MIHDLDFYSLTQTCVQIPLDRIFEGGFSTGHGVLREPNDIISYSALACIAIQSSQNDQHGGQSIPSLDYYLAPGVLKTYKKKFRDNMKKYLEVKFDLEEGVIGTVYGAIINKYGEIKTVEFSDEDKQRLQHTIEEVLYGIGVEIDKKVISKLVEFVLEKSYKETDKQTYQAMEAMVHNLNTMNSRAGSQVPFSSVNYGTDTSEEGRMVVRNLLEATIAGLGDGETPIFPIQIYKVKKGVNLDKQDPNYDLFKLAMKTSAKRLFPNFSFLDAPYNLKYYKEGDHNTEVAYMGCRTRVLANVHDPDNEVSTGRGNLSFTSINLPRLALENRGKSLEEFYKELEGKLDLTIRQLDKRFKLQSSKKVKNFPFLMGQNVWIDTEGMGPEDTIGEVLKHGTLSIGSI